MFAVQAVLTYVLFFLLPVLSEELKTAMRLLGATRVADLNMQHVSLFGKLFFWLNRRFLMLLVRSMLGLWNSRFMMGLLALRSSECGYRRSCSRCDQKQWTLSMSEILAGLSIVG